MIEGHRVVGGQGLIGGAVDADGIVGVLRRAQAWESALDGGRVGLCPGDGGNGGSASHGGKRTGRCRAMAGLVGVHRAGESGLAVAGRWRGWWNGGGTGV